VKWKLPWMTQPSTSMVIRFARIGDVRVVRTLVEKMIREATTDRVPSTDRSSAIAWATRNKEILVAEENSGVVGFIHGVLHEDIIDGAPNLFITSFFVIARRRNEGIGSSLLNASIQYAIKKEAS